MVVRGIRKLIEWSYSISSGDDGGKSFITTAKIPVEGIILYHQVVFGLDGLLPEEAAHFVPTLLDDVVTCQTAQFFSIGGGWAFG